MWEEGETNSFYDVNQIEYSPEELQQYRDLAGMPLFESYEELMRALDNGSKKGSAGNKKMQKKPSERRINASKKR